jgi:FO synthase
MEETISRMAGSGHGERQSPEALEAAARAVGRPVAQRATDYSIVAPRAASQTGVHSRPAGGRAAQEPQQIA